VDSTSTQVVSLSPSLKDILNDLKESIQSEFFIVMDSEMKKGVGHWASKWDHVAEVYAIKFEEDDFTELYWSTDYIEDTAIDDLKQEWVEFCYGIPYVWYYALSRCDEIRMSYLLLEGEEFEYEWMDAQTRIAQKIMTTDVNNKSKIYVQALSLAFQEDSFVYPGDVSIIGDFLLENHENLKVVNDVQNLLNLILLAQYIVQ
jgi:peptide deformylase